MFRWQNIMRFVNKETLLEEHARQSRRKATGVDGVTKDEYDVDVHGHIDRLLERMKRFQYRPQAGQEDLYSKGQRQAASAGNTGIRGQTGTGSDGERSERYL